mmetsp:Transcript_10289/g.25183  ORF Transcript_10289/g.25183 Transcript_10289/m.25183 type:complete len:193 (+) Transcript_10289:661-1239(+)
MTTMMIPPLQALENLASPADPPARPATRTTTMRTTPPWDGSRPPSSPIDGLPGLQTTKTTMTIPSSGKFGGSSGLRQVRKAASHEDEEGVLRCHLYQSGYVCDRHHRYFAASIICLTYAYLFFLVRASSKKGYRSTNDRAGIDTKMAASSMVATEEEQRHHPPCCATPLPSSSSRTTHHFSVPSIDLIICID